VTSRQLQRWSALHDRRAGSWWSSPWLIAVACGGVLAAFVRWRDAGGAAAPSHAWLAGTIVAFAVAFLRVPFHIYWRADAALLAQLPIEGGALFDVALVRCARAAAATTLTAIIGAAPFAGALAHASIASGRAPFHLFVRHAVLAGALGLAAAFLVPAVATWAAMLVATGRTTSGIRALRVVTAIAGAGPRRVIAAAQPQPRSSPSAILGALPGFASSFVIVAVIVASSSWLLGDPDGAPGEAILGALAGTSIFGILAVRISAPRVMGTILRDVSALDRQRLATLEIKPPTAIERAIAAALGEAALPYRKDARLMRRRYPMAYALGALAFLVLAIVALSRPRDPTPWLVVTLSGATIYALALAGRLYRPPIELPRLAATLPITPAARTRAKLGWLAGWVGVFVVIPAVFALWRLR
jgi:hypothetical protein